jgi:acetylornithine deacetylase/succinyl-diaminopimelate desuccinylase-like protein
MASLVQPQKTVRSSRLVADLARQKQMGACLEWYSKERAWINEQHLRVCRIPAPTFREQERAEWMVEQLRELDWDAKLDRAGNVIATRGAKRDSPLVAVTAHLDTVLSPRSADDIKIGSEGRFVGPGVSDNGAGLAALLAIAASWQALDPIEEAQSGLLIVANVGEEGEGNLSGMRYLCRQSMLAARVRAFLVLDGPATDHITYRALASRRFDVTITGRGGHSWSDFGIGNPVHALSRAVTLFTDQRMDLGNGPRSSFNFGIFEGGSSVNSIPGTARAKVDLRSEDSAELERMTAMLVESTEQAIELENRYATAGRVTAKMKEIGSRPGGSVPPDAPILEYLRAVDAHQGIRAQLDCASTDANIPLSMGIQAVSIGAGGQGGGAHTPGEWGCCCGIRTVRGWRRFDQVACREDPPGGRQGLSQHP